MSITVESLLAIGIATIATGVGLIQADKLVSGGIIAVVGFGIIGARFFLKKNNC
jgi:hypothetical protein